MTINSEEILMLEDSDEDYDPDDEGSGDPGEDDPWGQFGGGKWNLGPS